MNTSKSEETDDDQQYSIASAAKKFWRSDRGALYRDITSNAVVVGTLIVVAFPFVDLLLNHPGGWDAKGYSEQNDIALNSGIFLGLGILISALLGFGDVRKNLRISRAANRTANTSDGIPVPTTAINFQRRERQALSVVLGGLILCAGITVVMFTTADNPGTEALNTVMPIVVIVIATVMLVPAMAYTYYTVKSGSSIDKE